MWLVLSNAALCLGMPAPAGGGAHLHGAPGAHGASHAMHHQAAHDAHAEHGAHAPPLAALPDCCASIGEYPCCTDSTYAPAFDAPALAKLVAAAPPPEAAALAPVVPLRPVLVPARAVVPVQAGPPLYIRCCSFLI
jgi:hypothetical protein